MLSPAAFADALRALGAERYHHLHPFHRRLHGGACTRGEVEAWALNRTCYQAAIPRKDATLIARCADPAIRSAWAARLADHDGPDGGLARWLRLTDALGLSRELVLSERAALPATRFAVAAYVRFVAEMPTLDAIASSLTELFAPAVIGERVGGMLRHYPFVTPAALAYFDRRPAEARRDSEWALAHVLAQARTGAEQERALAALGFKLDLLWSMLDALEHAYVTPGRPPPGAYRPAPAHVA